MHGTCAKPNVRTHKNFVSERFRELAEPIDRDEKIEDIIKRAAKAVNAETGLRLIYSRAYEIWYGRAKATIEEKEAVSAALKAKARKEARDEYQELVTRLQMYGARLAQIDPDFHSENISALRLAVRGRG